MLKMIMINDLNNQINEKKLIEKKNEELIKELKNEIENLILENNEIKKNLNFKN